MQQPPSDCNNTFAQKLKRAALECALEKIG